MKLSIIISNRNDIVMLNVTLNNLIDQMRSVEGGCEIIVADNSDQREWNLMGVAIPDGWKRKGLVRLVRDERHGFSAARHLAANQARGEYLFCVDSHILLGRNTLRDSVDFMERHKDDPNLGFGHPPIRWSHQGPAAVKHTLKPADNGHPNGGWDCAYTEERKMYWKFMPWICRREWFLKTLQGYGTHAWQYMSWGGAEPLMQTKSLMLGYENWAIITDPLVHIGPFTPKVIALGQYKYRTYGPGGTFPHGLGVLVALVVLCGPELGRQLAELNMEKFFNRHKFRLDDTQKGRDKTYWELAVSLGIPEHNWLKQRAKYDYLTLINEKPWNE